MKYSKGSVLFTTLALSGVVVRASGVANEHGKPVDTHSSSLWNYFGFGKKVQAVPAVEAKDDRDESWSLVNVEVDSDDEYDLAFEEEIVAKGEIEAHRREEEKRALERHDQSRLARVKRAEEDEALHAWAMPHEPKTLAEWYNQAAPVVFQKEEEAVMKAEPEDEQAWPMFLAGEAVMKEGEPEDEQALEMFFAGEAVMKEDELEDQQPVYEEEVPLAPPMDDDIPEAPLLEDVVVPMRAPVYEVAENIQKPKDPNVFRGKTVQMGIAKFDESAASAAEASQIQRFKAEFQAAQDRDGRRRVVNSIEQAAKENPKFLELHKLSMDLRLKVHRGAIETDEESEGEEEVEFD